MQAIILAAGMGKRLKSLTKSNTKCMVEVNGVSLIDRMLHQIEKKCLSRIVIEMCIRDRSRSIRLDAMRLILLSGVR